MGCAWEKQILQEKFFPEQSETDLSDIGTIIYPIPVLINNEIDAVAIRTQIIYALSRKAPEPDKIINEF